MKKDQSDLECSAFRCEFCRTLFKHKRSRDRHLKLHTGDRRYKCSCCNAAFFRSDHLKIHTKTHDQQKPFQCETCNRGYNTPAALTAHKQNHKRSSEMAATPTPSAIGFKCLQCSSVFSQPEELRSHMNLHQPSTTSSEASSLPNFKRNRLPQLHKNLFEKLFGIGYVLTKIKQKSDPIITTSRLSSQQSLPFQEAFYHCLSSPMDLQKHMNIIDDALLPSTSYSSMLEWIYRAKLYCVYCAKSFLTPTIFAEHYIKFHGLYHFYLLQLLTSEQNEPTDLSLNTKSTIDNQQHYLPNNFNLMPSVSFANVEFVHPHLRLHIEKPKDTTISENLKCSHCHLMFSSIEKNIQLIKHFSIISTAYSCESCLKVFIELKELQKHLMNIHTQILHGCSICNEVFNSKSAVQNHFSFGHNNQVTVYRCTHCPTTANMFYSEAELMAHVNATHIDDSCVCI